MAKREFYWFAWECGPALTTHEFDPIPIDPPANVLAEVALTRVGNPDGTGPVFAIIQIVKASSASGDETLEDGEPALYREELSSLTVEIAGRNGNVTGRLILHFDD